MMRIRTAAMALALAGMLVLPVPGIRAQTAASGTQMAQASAPADLSLPRRDRRPPRRVPIYPREQVGPDGVYPRYNPGPNAVRDCSVQYVQEFRPSGTVITPHMHCFWRAG